MPLSAVLRPALLSALLLLHGSALGDSLQPDMARVMQSVRISGCEGYPYGEIRPAAAAEQQLRRDLQQGLQRGLQCLAGNGPAGPLHPYHEAQARRLVALLESPQVKHFLCVADEMYADAVATQAEPLPQGDGLAPILQRVRHPAVVLDVYRIGGLLSQRYSEETYRQFFNLSEPQIREHLTGQPLHLDSSHRYSDMSALLFHEVVHWLGHSHSYIHPDVTHLYETCCFGGSDYIDDPALNQQYQREACNILRDDELWSANRYQKVRLWHHKGYDLLKGRMREAAD